MSNNRIANQAARAIVKAVETETGVKLNLDTCVNIVSVISAAIDESKTGATESCIWAADEDDIYYTQCGDAFFFDTGTPKENNMVYCPYCGKTLAVKETGAVHE